MPDPVDPNRARRVVHGVQDAIVPFSHAPAVDTRKLLGAWRTGISLEVIEDRRDELTALSRQALQLLERARFELEAVAHSTSCPF